MPRLFRSCSNPVSYTHLDVYKRQAGVDGNGQSQLAQVVTGVLTPDAGRVDLKGSRVAQFTPNGFILESVSHIPEDRNKMGLIGDMSVQENIVLKLSLIHI